MKSEKKTILALSAVFIILATAFAVYGIEGKLIRTSLLSQEPDPAEPGGYLDLRFKIENYGDSLINDVEVKLIEGYPFSLDPGEDAVQFIGDLDERQKDESGYIVKYRVKVDEDAVEGENTVKLAYRYPGEFWVEKEFTVNIRTTDIVLSVESVESVPRVITPGKDAKLTISLQNLADSVIRDIRVKLDLSSSEIPFVPTKSTTEKKIYQIGSKSSKEVAFDLMATADAETGAYKIPISLDYYDEIGTSYSKDDIISLIIGTQPDLTVGIDETEIYKTGTSGIVTFKFVNKGLIDLKFVNAVLGESEDYTIVSPAEVYIGNIDSDDFESIEYSIHADTGKDEIVFPLKIEYMDDNNNEFDEKRDVKLKLYSSEEARKVGLEEKPAVGILIIAIIVIVGLIAFWRIRKRKKNKKRQQ